MISFKLDPPSGYADSYQDIRFEVSFPKVDKAELRLFNDSAHQQLEILSVTQGYIADEKVAVGKRVSSLEGFFNIFNRDKMNRSLAHHVSVNIRAQITLIIDSHTEVLESTQTFYNESKSLDSQVVPFDISIQNADHLQSGAPLRITLISDSERKFELSIRDRLGTKACTFEIFAFRGQTTVSLPAEVIYHDLRLMENKSPKSFDIYWTKFEGLTYSKFMNRKYVLLPGTTLLLPPGQVVRNSQTRLGPGGELPADFVLSDRYFVHTHKTYSAFGEKTLHPVRLKRLTFFMHEAQDVQNKTNEIVALSQERNERMSEVRNLIKQEQLKRAPRHLGVSQQNKFLEEFSPIYSKRIADAMPATFATQAATAPTTEPTSVRKSGGCAGCGRKR